MRFYLTSAAEEEFADAAEYMLQQSLNAAMSFVDEISNAIEDIAEFPYRYPIYHSDIRVRRVHVHPYSIFYRIRIDHVLILSISHDAREESYWRDRL